MSRQVVHRIEDGMDRQQVACTTYQQRNIFTQMRDGFFGRNEVFNYVLHHQVARWASRLPAGAEVLDVCCGRGLHLPMLRYQAKQLGGYTGLDIKRGNATWLERRVTDGKLLTEVTGAATPLQARMAYYPWPTYFVEGNVAHADTLLSDPGRAPYTADLIIYTASIEHMHPDDGRRSLRALRALAAADCTLILTCPNTPEGQDGYDTRYRAHVYEWKLRELREAVTDAGWHIAEKWGLDMGVREMAEAMEAEGMGDQFARLRQFVPQEWLVPVLAPLFTAAATEVGLLCTTGLPPDLRPIDGQTSLFDEGASE